MPHSTRRDAGRALAAQPEKRRIGYQKSSTLMIFLKSRGTLEKALAPLQVNVQWHEFTSGLPLQAQAIVVRKDSPITWKKWSAARSAPACTPRPAKWSARRCG